MQMTFKRWGTKKIHQRATQITKQGCYKTLSNSTFCQEGEHAVVVCVGWATKKGLMEEERAKFQRTNQGGFSCGHPAWAITGRGNATVTGGGGGGGVAGKGETSTAVHVHGDVSEHSSSDDSPTGRIPGSTLRYSSMVGSVRSSSPPNILSTTLGGWLGSRRRSSSER